MEDAPMPAELARMVALLATAICRVGSTSLIVPEDLISIAQKFEEYIVKGAKP